LESEDLQEEELLSFKNDTKNLCDNIDKAIQERMEEKQCKSAKEFEDRYLEYASKSKNRATIVGIEAECLKSAQKFINKVNEYQITQSYEEAQNLLQELKEKVSQLEKDKAEAINIAKGMGYADSSLDYLKAESAKLEASIKSLAGREITGDLIQEQQEKLKQLIEENIEQQFFNLQKKIRTPDKNLSQINQEVNEKELEVKEKTDYFNCLNIAEMVMQEASDEIRQSFGPELNKKAAEIFKNFTKGKYGNMIVTKDYDISIQAGIHYREWRYLSNGTVDQAYLALRLAITELISDKSIALPIFLDDVLMQYDDERIDAALSFACDYAKQKGQEFQLILFTCHQHIIEHSKPYTDKVVNI
jgi:DNA repair protein SbcC/Rad50